MINLSNASGSVSLELHEEIALGALRRKRRKVKRVKTSMPPGLWGSGNIPKGYLCRAPYCPANSLDAGVANDDEFWAFGQSMAG